MDKELERLAREAGMEQEIEWLWCANMKDLERFAILVEQLAMERAAVICDERQRSAITVTQSIEAADCAAAIRSSAPRANGGEG